MINLSLRVGANNWLERRREKSSKKADEKILSSSVQHGEPYHVACANIRGGSGKYVVFRDMMKGNGVKFTVSDHKNPQEAIAILKVGVSPDESVNVKSAWTKQLFSDVSPKKHEAYESLSGILAEAVDKHIRIEHDCCVEPKILSHEIKERMMEDDLAKRRAEFVEERVSRAKSTLDKKLAEKRISREQHEQLLKKAGQFATSLFISKILEEDEKIAKKRK